MNVGVVVPEWSRNVRKEEWTDREGENGKIKYNDGTLMSSRGHFGEFKLLT